MAASGIPGRWTQAAVILGLAGLCIGCSWRGSMRPTVNLEIPRMVRGSGYPAPDRTPEAAFYNSLSISLREAPPFLFTFPDGHRASSREIGRATLAAHLAPIITDEKGSLVSRLNVIDGERNHSIVFLIGEDGMASQVWLYTCKQTLRGLLATADGTRSFDFPLKQFEIAALFGGPMRIGRDFVILGYACD